MSAVQVQDLVVRAAEPGDDASVVPMLRASLGKVDDPHYEAFLHWKHRENSFGPSPAWVALHDGEIVGYRTFLRWRVPRRRRARGLGGASRRHRDRPGIPGDGHLPHPHPARRRGADPGRRWIVFNTPNDQSRPGYLKMGWTVARQLPVGVLPAGPRALATMVTSRVPGSPVVGGDGCRSGCRGGPQRALGGHRPAPARTRPRLPDRPHARVPRLADVVRAAEVPALAGLGRRPRRGRHRVPPATPRGCRRGGSRGAARPRPPHRSAARAPTPLRDRVPTTPSGCAPARRRGCSRCPVRGRCSRRGRSLRPPPHRRTGPSRSGTSSSSDPERAAAQPSAAPAASTTGANSSRWSTCECTSRAVHAAAPTTVAGALPSAARSSPVSATTARMPTPTHPVSDPTWSTKECAVEVSGSTDSAVASGNDPGPPPVTGCARQRAIGVAPQLLPDPVEGPLRPRRPRAAVRQRQDQGGRREARAALRGRPPTTGASAVATPPARRQRRAARRRRGRRPTGSARPRRPPAPRSR